MPLIDRVNSLVEKGYEAKLTQVVEQLEKEVVLPEELQAKLDSLGDTPMAEPELFEAINNAEQDGKVAIALLALSEEEIVKFKASDVGNFIHAVEQKIVSQKDSSGVFKSTPATEACRLPNFIECELIRKLLVTRDACVKKWVATKTDKGKATAMKEFEKFVKDLSEKALEISGLDQEGLTDWEKALVIAQVMATSTDAFLCATGKPSGN